MINKSNITLGQLLKSLRSEKGLALAVIEDKTGLSKSYINRLENENRCNALIDNI